MTSPIRRKPLPSQSELSLPSSSLEPPPYSPSPPPLRHARSAQALPRYPGLPDAPPSPYLAVPPHRAATDARPASSSSSPDVNGLGHRHGHETTQGPSINLVQKAYGEARHFLGGLIAHPTESTRHVTILRHSPGVVFYRGSTTSVTVSIFCDHPLPPDRSLWLQSKGWTGKTGMSAKALFRLTDDWLNVTPSVAVTTDQVEPSDERAWQRDISKFRKKASGRARTHELRETVVARLPVDAGDGYFSLVLCHGNKKVLCKSPVFRILSTSLNPSSLRGASLAAMPLEVGALVLSMYVQKTAETILTPAAAAIQSRVKPGTVNQTAAQTAFSLSGTGDRIGSVMARNARPGAPALGAESVLAVPLEDGPQAPFPLDLKARGALQPMSITPDPGMVPPRFALQKVPDHILESCQGFFPAWARFDQGKDRSRSPITAPTSPSPVDGKYSTWYPTVVSFRSFDPMTGARVNLSQTMKKTAHIRFLEPIPSTHSPTLKLHIRIMGYLRADIPPPNPRTAAELQTAREVYAEAATLADSCDASYTLNILDHPAWAPDLEQGHRGRGDGWMERTRQGYANARDRGQRAIANVPLHWVGVRSPTAGVIDQRVAVSGFYIPRGNGF